MTLGGKGIQPEARARALKGAGLLAILAVSAAAYLGGALRPVDSALAQLRFSLIDRPASETLTVVEIDVRSLRAAGSWPWSRARYAQAIDNLNAAGAELVGFDVDFSARSSDPADSALEASVRRRPGTVVLPTFVQSTGEGSEKQLVESSPLASVAEEAVLASVNVPLDADGEVRRYQYGFAMGEAERLSMGSTLAGRQPGRVDSFVIDYGIRVADIDRLSFESAYLGEFDPALVRGRKILIGATALELGDEFTTPKGTLPGVYVHALAYESLYAGRALTPVAAPFLLLLAMLAAYLLRPRATMDLSKTLRRHALIGGGALLVPIAVQAALPVAVDTSAILLTQALCLFWATRTELKRRTQAVVEAREAHLIQLAAQMRRSRNSIRVANRKLQASNRALDKALQARTEFLAATSHEIRTPLNGILGMTQVILADRGLSPGLRDKVGVVRGAGETMLALVSDILDVAQIETGNLTISPVDMDFRKLLDDTAQLWAGTASAKGVAVTADYADAPAWITADPTRLRQILFNLMSNAVKFTDEGEVGLRVRVEPQGADEAVVLEISDSGIGIPADQLDVIFESFRQVDGSITRKYGGTGLGLAICRQLTLAMGGDITVASALGEGSTFTVRLPLVRAAGSSVPASGSAESAERLEAASILLVESNPLAQSVLKAALSAQASSVEVVASADAALAALASRRFDLVLAEGKTLAADPADAARGLAGLVGAADGRVCVLWGGAEAEIAALMAAGAVRVVRKPISAADLITELRALRPDGAAETALQPAA